MKSKKSKILFNIWEKPLRAQGGLVANLRMQIRGLAHASWLVANLQA
ncbi:MAG: hypothetical protein LBK13_05605 [Spirochaetales bacterium]|jgi:hypothetical protein|nr:hypothetical protein [Spirochaetales bacterium]